MESEDVSWDVLTLPAADALAFARTGYLEPIDFAVVDKSPLVPDIVLQYAVGEAFFSTVIVYPRRSARGTARLDRVLDLYAARVAG